jgi:hypothetical protein
MEPVDRGNDRFWVNLDRMGFPRVSVFHASSDRAAVIAGKSRLKAALLHFYPRIKRPSMPAPNCGDKP